jgi:hypothetical protein
MKEKKCTYIFFFAIIILSLSSMCIAYQNQDLKLTITIFLIPPHQSIVKGGEPPPAKEGEVGGVRGEQIGGYVTASFPDGIVLFESDLFKSIEDFTKSIKEHVRFCCPEVVSILPLSKANILIDTENLEASVINKELYAPPPEYSREYSLKVQPLSIENEEAVLKVKFSIKIKPTDREKKELLNQTLGIKFPKTLLVGFPAKEDGHRGTVYWLAFSFSVDEKKTF